MIAGPHGASRLLRAAGLALALVGPALDADSALADPSVPGWRNFTTADRIEAAPGTGPQPVVRMISRRGGKAGLDQTLGDPPGEFAIRTRGRVMSGRGVLLLEWTEGEERVLKTDTRSLEFADGISIERFRSPPGADQLRVAVLQDAGNGTLELDSVELREPGGRRFLNQGLALVGCPEDNTRRVIPYGVRRVPGWRTQGEETILEVARRRESRSPPLRLLALEGPGGISQSSRVSSLPLELVLRGRGDGAGASVAIEWHAATKGGPTVQDARVPIRLDAGSQIIRVRPPPVAGPLRLVIAVAQVGEGNVSLDSVEARMGPRQILQNPDLNVRPCPPAPVAPAAAGTLDPTVRWPLTALLMGLAALFLVLVARAGPSRDAPEPPPPGRWTRRALLGAVALVPFVSIGTVQAGFRVIPADWAFLALAAVLFVSASHRRSAFSDRSRVVALASSIALAIVSAISLVLALRFWSDNNLAGLVVREQVVDSLGRPAVRGGLEELRLVQGIACLFVMLALVNTARMWTAVARVIAIVGAVVAAYGLYQVGAQELLGHVPQPPYAYKTSGLRAGGTFPEPTAFAGFLVFAAACAAAVLELRRDWLMVPTILVIIGGVGASRSTVGLVGLGLLLAVLLGLRRGRAAAVVLVPAVLALVAVAAFGGSDQRVREAYTKPFGVSESLLDREAVWGAAWRMGTEYSPGGAGRGQFAYNQAPFVDPEDADRGGRANSAILEVWAESGPLGLLLGVAAVAAGPLALLRRRKRPEAPPGPARMIVWAIFVSFVGVMALYFTTSFVWPWVAVGLLASAPRALRARAPTETAAPKTVEVAESYAGPDPGRRVLHVMRMSGVSGAERHLLQLTTSLREQGWTSDVLIPSPDPGAVRDFSVELAGVCRRVAVVPMKRDWSLRLVWQLRSLLRSGEYAVSHAHLVHADWHLGAASLFARRTALVSSKHNHDPFRTKFPARTVERATAGRYDEVISISESLSRFTREWSGTRSATVLYGLSAGDRAPDRDAVYGSLLAVGRLEPQKGLEVLLQAMPAVLKAVPDAFLAIAGEGSERERLEALIDDLGLQEAVTLLGLRTDVPRLMRDASVLVHPARWEGFGLVLLEAMREGLPIVATRVSAVPEVVEEGVTGLLVPADDPRAFAEAVVRMLTEQGLAQAAGAAGFLRLKRRFDPRRMARETAEIYARAVTARRARR